MASRISQQSHTFNEERLREVFRTERECIQDILKSKKDTAAAEFKPVSLEGRIKRERAEILCDSFFRAVQDPLGHATRIDRIFSISLSFEVMPWHTVANLSNLASGSKNETDVLQYANEKLSRLPSEPPYVSWPNISFSELDNDYFLPGSSRSWESLRVVSLVSAELIRLMLYRGMRSPVNELGWLDAMAELFEIICTKAMKTKDTRDKRAWFVAIAFLWTTWHRFMLLFSAHVLDWGLGWDTWPGGFVNSIFGLRPLPAVMMMFSQSVSHNIQSQGGLQLPAYICKCAFKIVYQNRGALGLDFRMFCKRYAELPFANRRPRCRQSKNPQKFEQCDGHRENCQRFQGSRVEDQSAHTKACRGNCTKMLWDKEDYLSCEGARAVSLDRSSIADKRLRYCIASNMTLAVSHVWLHGQGGRPETGLNSCLHHRYCTIARAHGCDSYWMDTPCIPEDHHLRREAIGYINEIFKSSRVTLVCDRDLMEIEVSNILDSVPLRESLLAALLVCDWNARAWTLLEAMKGRHNTHLLCKDDRTVSFLETLKAVQERGSLELVVLFLTTQHLFPMRDQGMLIQRPGEIENRNYDYMVGMEQAACLLSQRHASRSGDDIVIWSLLCDMAVSMTAEEFWRARIGTLVNTGFLMSSIPRLSSCSGLTWAPSGPGFLVQPARSEMQEKNVLVYDGSHTYPGFLDDTIGFCLVAKWWVFAFQFDENSNTGAELNLVRAEDKILTPWLLENSPFLGPDLQERLHEVRAQYLHGEYQIAALLQPHGRVNADKPVRYQGKTEGTLMAVISSCDGFTWTWRGVYEWKEPISLPQFRPQVLLLT